MNQELDTSGLKCPLPVLKAKKALRAMEPGEVIRVTATDPDSMQDFPEYCANAGHQLLQAAEAEGVFTFRIRKSG
ncbi:MAG: sulfurtransferase TusA family protein [Rhodospirillales bacterium]|jgi:tRNA 2-thiouridine synthesizing protein A|nr:sulfurtransferase TusA family protein [Rhodospirillales bacterium]MDP6643650.1 sulfurtransferase TusA family protein [Rhodospirillales bacterium]MDP6840253.1 sulfurtransferase TusA family protein [Rhodospirillales bacterium]|tara:strand:- start:231 stop:455 length:225 start_codon:yes stop_codon:yes gene_type:complete